MFLDQQKFMKAGELVTVMDFAENYRCANQDEMQAAYWNYQQATIHPMVNYLRCSACNNVKTATVIVISDDLQHDHHAADTKNLEHFKKENIDLHELTQWSDGCGTQYKFKGPFARLQTAPARYNVKQVNRNFFGSRHGKNPSDGVSANVKNKATRAVRCRRAVIQNAEELFKFLQENMTVTSDGCNRHNSRHFIYVRKEEVRRETISCIPLKGTRQVHSLKADESGDCLLYRNLTCKCQGCTESDGTTCANSLHVKEWQRQDMIQTKSLDKEATPEENTETTDLENTADSSHGLLSQSAVELLEELNEASTVNRSHLQ